MKNLFLFVSITVCLIGCKPATQVDAIKPQAKVCVATLHHAARIPETEVYLKYNTTVFPGWDYKKYDRKIITDSNAAGCFDSLPVGNYWLMATGYDANYRSDVIGQQQFSIQKINEQQSFNIMVSETH